MRVITFLSYLFAIIGPIAGVGLVAYGLIARLPPATYGGVVLLIAPIVLYFVVRNIGAKQGKPAFEAATTTNFKADHAEWFSGSGIALDLGTGRILVADSGMIGVYPLADVSGQKYENLPGGYSSVAGASSMGVLGGLMALFALIAVIVNYFQAGLFVTVRGSARPSWQMFGIRPKQAAHWQKLLAEHTPAAIVPRR